MYLSESRLWDDMRLNPLGALSCLADAVGGHENDVKSGRGDVGVVGLR